MKAKLINRDNGNYKLYVDEIPYATTDNSPYKRLSKQNCDEIFGLVDVDNLVDKFVENLNVPEKVKKDVQFGYQEGFLKAMELNKDKVFTLEDMKNAFYNGWNYRGEDYQWPTAIKEYLQHLQQLNEIEVEIVKESIGRVKLGVGSQLEQMMPKLDSNGCLILKKI